MALERHRECIEAGLAPDTIDSAMVIDTIRRADPASIKAARSFIDLLGAFAGDLALLYEASGGVVIGGGIMPRLARVLPLEGLRTRFEAKGRYRTWLASVPLDLMASPWAALRGAAAAYL